MDDERIETFDAREIWLHGISDEHPDRQCPNCSEPIDTDRLEEPDPEERLLLCPDCGAELPFGAVLVKAENRESSTYFPHAGTSVEGPFTVIRFNH